MSGTPRTLGYKKPSRCKYCQAWILWQKSDKRAVPFDASFDDAGNAFTVGMHQCPNMPYSIRTAGDRDTEARRLWREKYTGTNNVIGIAAWEEIRKGLAKALSAPGSPFALWSWQNVVPFFINGNHNDYGVIHEVRVQHTAILNRIHCAVHGYEPADKPIQICGIYLIPTP